MVLITSNHNKFDNIVSLINCMINYLYISMTLLNYAIKKPYFLHSIQNNKQIIYGN
jgi:hypothetical protein